MLDSEAGPWPGSPGQAWRVAGVQGPARIHLPITGLTRWSACSLAGAWPQEGTGQRPQAGRVARSHP